MSLHFRKQLNFLQLHFDRRAKIAQYATTANRHIVVSVCVPAKLEYVPAEHNVHADDPAHEGI